MAARKEYGGHTGKPHSWKRQMMNRKKCRLCGIVRMGQKRPKPDGVV
jgi:hypothetical protein